MASKPSAARIYRVISDILQRKYAVSISYTVVPAGHSGLIFTPDCYEKATKIDIKERKSS